MKQNFFKKFPFFWGAATSSHQVEGGNRHNDWWAWEQSGRLKFPSGDACDHFRRFHEDFELIASLGHNAYRFSIEWSRIEPEEGKWDFNALATYGEMIRVLRKKNIEPIVTLHHFTNPQWFAEKGGWLLPNAADYFARYVRKVVETIGHDVNFWITINEPLIFLSHSYYLGVWPPGHHSFKDAIKVFENLLLAHIKAYQVIHWLYEAKFHHPVWVSIAKHILYSEPCRKYSLADRLTVFLRGWFFNDLFLRAAVSGFLFFPGIFCKILPFHHTLDFIGINYYSRHFVRFHGFAEEAALFGSICDETHHGSETIERNSLGWQVYAEGLYKTLIHLKKFGLPLMITENGICTQDDEQRCRFIQTHLEAVRRAQKKVPIMGYLYWSLLDNFEWDKGFDPRFGIVDVDFKTFQRKVRKSAYVLGDICRKFSHESH